MKSEKVIFRNLIWKGFSIVFLAFFMCAVTRIPVAADTVMETDVISCVNPIYEDTHSLEELQNQPMLMLEDDVEYYSSLEAAGVALRQAMKERKAAITVGYWTEDEYDKQFGYAIFDEAVRHTGVPTEGDYLLFQYASWSCRVNGYQQDGIWYYSFAYTLNYYVNAAQEAVVDAKVEQIINALNLGNSGTYVKIKAVYDYLCANVVYDYTNLNNDSHKIKYTAYGALIDGTSVCQGYAVAFYRLALELGVDTRIISGDSNGEPHSWNIAEIRGNYYYADSTWDAPGQTYTYFLKGSSAFPDHTNDEEYTTESFFTEYPVSVTSYQVIGNDSKLHYPMHINKKESTCVEPGYTGDSMCFECGEIFIRGHEITLEDHNWEKNYTVDKAAACLTTGVKSIHCDYCDVLKVGSKTVIPAKGHTFGKWIVKKAATYSASGTETRTCTVCKYTESRVIPKKTGFTDVPTDTWYYNSVLYVQKNGIMNGLTESTFGPEQTILRSQFATMLYRLEGSPKVTYKNYFADVAGGLWYSDAIIWANDAGIVTGYGNGLFGTNDSITREQMAVMMYRYASYKHLGVSILSTSILDGFADGRSVSGFAMAGMSWALEEGIITGKYLNGQVLLAPGDSATRAECATIFMRFMEKY